MPTVITSMHVREDCQTQFHDFQVKISLLVREQPGFSGREVICPVAPYQEAWVILFRFDNNENLQSWLHHPERLRLLEEIGASLEKPMSFQVVASDPQSPQPASAVFSHRVQPEKEEQFHDWKRRLIEARSHFPGLLDSEMYEPVPGIQEDWIDIVRFDSSENLNAWFNSAERKQFLEEAKELSIDSSAHSVATGLENWFHLQEDEGQSTPSIPSWKQASLVLLALFPVALIVHLILRPLPAELPWPAKVLLGNFIGVAALTWVLMPRISQLFAFWCRPPAQSRNWRVHLLGGILLYGIIFSILALAIGLLG